MRLLGARQSGQTLALAAVALIGLVGAIAFAIDVGFFLEARREMQDSADSAALAGVVYLAPTQDTASAKAAALQVVGQNGPIMRQLCGYPNNSVGPTATVTSSKYLPDPTNNPQNFYYQLQVSLECDPGFSFGKILPGFGATTEKILASSTAVIGGLGSVNCAAPLAAVQFPGTDIKTNFGYTPGLKFNSLPSGTFTSPATDGSDPILLDNQASSYIGPTAGACVECGDFFYVCLTSGTCNDEPTIQGWFAGDPCVKVNLQSNNISNSPSGFKDKSAFGGLDQRWCPPSGGSCLKGNTVTCPQTAAQVVNPSTWTVLPGQSSSPCVMQVMILTYSSVSACTGGPCPNLKIAGFATVFVSRYHGNTKKFEGVFVKAETLGDVTYFQANGTYTIRLIR